MLSRRYFFLCLVPLVLLGLAVPVGARGRSRTASLRHYHATGEYDVYVNGKTVKAEVLFSQRAATYVVALPGEKTALVLRQRSRSVGRVSSDALKRREDGYVELPTTAKVESLGRFRLSGPDVVISLTDLKARLKPRAALLKQHSGEQLLAHSPQYAMNQRSYRPSASVVQQLKATNTKAEVEVFFGSWCSRCQRLLGNMLRLEEALGNNSSIKFSYYGLPAPPAAWQDARYRASGVKGLPTAVVKVNGRVRGRLAHGAWSAIERSLLPLVR